MACTGVTSAPIMVALKAERVPSSASILHQRWCLLSKNKYRNDHQHGAMTSLASHLYRPLKCTIYRASDVINALSAYLRPAVQSAVSGTKTPSPAREPRGWGSSSSTTKTPTTWTRGGSSVRGNACPSTSDDQRPVGSFTDDQRPAGYFVVVT